MSRESKHIHFIGICGVAMSALAIAFKKAGPDASLGTSWHVTGSDAGFFPPVSTNLEMNGISFYPGWHPEKMMAEGTPDLVVVGNVASSTNPEWQYVQENKLPYVSYPELIAKYFIKPTSIVCAGTYGKTTTTALLSWILSQSHYEPSYMFGGLAMEDFPSAALGRGLYSVVEGDEYKSARWDNQPKFAHYHPTHLLLTGLEWDHADVYPTKEAYISVFKNLIESVPVCEEGSLPASSIAIVCTDNEEIRKLAHHSTAPLITYGQRKDALIQYGQIQQTTNGISFVINNAAAGHLYAVKSSLLGDYQAANITGGFAMANAIGVPIKKIIDAIATFPGLKRRLEKRYEGDITIFDDIAHSPAKATSTLKTLRKIYTGKIIAVFEPNTGNRQPASAPAYDHAFAAADEVIIPQLSKIKKDPTDPDEIFDGERLTTLIQNTHPHARHISDDTQLVNYLSTQTKKDDCVVFLGSHGFRGMIEKLVEAFS